MLELQEVTKMKGLIAAIALAAAITCIFIFGANAMLEENDAKNGRNKKTETTATVTVETTNGNALHDVFVERGM